MRTLMMSIALISFCGVNVISAKEETIRARITYYAGDKRVAWSKKKGAPVVGESIAAHPNFKFGSKVTIPALAGKIGDGNFEVQDRGPAVTAKVASKKKAYVFDVFVPSREHIKKYAKSLPQYMDVIIKD